LNIHAAKQTVKASVFRISIRWDFIVATRSMARTPAAEDLEKRYTITRTSPVTFVSPASREPVPYTLSRFDDDLAGDHVLTVKEEASSVHFPSF
jgi:hypothetical protein